MTPPLVISAAGFAKSGKSTFCDLVSRELEKRFKFHCCPLSFATTLRVDTQDFLEKCGFDVWKDVNKELFRPVLIWYASLKRTQTKGQYFIERLKRDFEIKAGGGYFNAFLISDLRFAEYSPNDEIDFCKQNGVVVHISRYKLALGTGSEESNNLIKHFDLPPNEFEAKNDPLIKERADYRLEWKNENGRVENLSSHITHFIDWLEQNYLSKNNHLP